MKFEGNGVPSIWRDASCLDRQELEIQKAELLDQNFWLQPPMQRSIDRDQEALRVSGRARQLCWALLWL